MANDEQAIRGLVDRWLAATKKRDLETVLKLMTEDVIFMVPGQEPFGKEGFAATFRVDEECPPRSNQRKPGDQSSGRLGLDAQSSQGDGYAAERKTGAAVWLYSDDLPQED